MVNCLKSKGGKLCNFMCWERQSGTISVTHWRSVDCRRMWHLTLQTGADCYTTSALTRISVDTHTDTHSFMLAAPDPLCVCHYHTSVSHWGPRIPEYACRISICKQDHLEMLLSGLGLFSTSHLSWCWARGDDSSGEVLDILWHKLDLRGRVRVEQPHPSFSNQKCDNPQRKCWPSQHQCARGMKYTDKTYWHR